MRTCFVRHVAVLTAAALTLATAAQAQTATQTSSPPADRATSQSSGTTPSQPAAQGAPATGQTQPSGQATQGQPSGSGTAQGQPSASGTAQAPTGSDAMNFDLLPPAPEEKPLDKDFEARVARRRTMLQWHQGLGFALMGSMALTTIFGQLTLNARTSYTPNRDLYQATHVVLATTTGALFVTVGALGLLAPTPYAKHVGFDTATVHKTLMGLATAGMITQIVLGALMGHNDSLVTAHQVVGYATLGTLAAGAFVYVF